MTFVLKQSHSVECVFVVIIICCPGAIKIKDSVEQIKLDYFQNCDVHEEVGITFDSADVTIDSVRSNYEKI